MMKFKKIFIMLSFFLLALLSPSVAKADMMNEMLFPELHPESPISQLEMQQRQGLYDDDDEDDNDEQDNNDYDVKTKVYYEDNSGNKHITKANKEQSTKENNKNKDSEDKDNKIADEITIVVLSFGTLIFILSIFIAIKIFMNRDEWNE